MTAPPSLVLRADASHRLGAGHVVRLSAIADAARAAGGRARIVIGGEPGRLVDALCAAGHDVVPADEAAPIASLAAHVRELRATAIVLDAPHLPARVVESLTSIGAAVASFDDGAAAPAHTPIVIDPGFGAERRADRHAGARVAMLGRRYAPLRAAFLRWPHGGPPSRPRDRLRVLLTFGGSDPLGATPRAVAALAAAPPLHVTVVTGAGYRHTDALEVAVRAACRAGHHVEVRGAVADMAALAASCDVAIAGAGGTLAELAYLGRPTAAYSVAPDQIAIARAQVDAGLVHGGLDSATTDDDALAASLGAFFAGAAAWPALAARAAATVDGLGASRIVSALKVTQPDSDIPQHHS